MTDEEWDEWADSIEARIKRGLALIVSLAGAVALTVLSLVAAWHQVMDAQEGVALNAEITARQEGHIIVNDNRLDKIDAPPPDAAVAERAAAIPPATVP